MSAECIACGMPMETAEDHAMGDLTVDYCIYCARPDGSMQSYDEKLESMIKFLMRIRGLTEDEARREALARMGQLPAWKDRKKTG
jgi:hypothetical protein